MNLSVVMGVVDKVRAPLRSMTSDSDKYARRIREIQTAQADTRSSMTMVQAMNSSRITFERNALAIDTAREKLAALEAKNDSAGGSSAALSEKIAKQRARLSALETQQTSCTERLSRMSTSLTEAGVDVSQLDSEFERLSNRYRDHGSEIERVSTRYQRLQDIMSRLQAVNRMPSIAATSGAAIGVSGASFGIGMLLNDTASQINVISKAANDVQIPFKDLQVMRMQASMAGAEAEEMDAAIKEMVLRWGEMKTLKSGAMNDYFKDTGNKQAYDDIMNARDSAETYQILIREIAKEGNVEKQNFMSDEFFGGDSEKILSVLKSGTDGFNKARQLLDETGGPISQESEQSANAFSRALKKLSVIVNSLKISALTPIMSRLSLVMEGLAINMKNMKWREEAIEKVSKIVNTTFLVFKGLGNAVIFATEQYKEIIAVVALFKIGMFALNAAMMSNPIGLIIAGIAAAAVGTTYLIDKFNIFNVALKYVSDGADYLWLRIKMLISHIPQNLLPDSWKSAISNMDSEVDSLASKINKIKDKNAKIGITTTEKLNKSVQRDMRPISSFGAYSPLNNHQKSKSKSEVSLIIKSDKPVTVDKLKNEGIDLNLDLGNLMMSY